MQSLFESMNAANADSLLRVACGAFLIPHIYAKFFVPEALSFFKAAGFEPPAAWMYLAGVVELVLAAALILGLYTAPIGWIAAAHLTVAAVAVHRVTGKWLWNIGGAEYCWFWAIACAVVAIRG